MTALAAYLAPLVPVLLVFLVASLVGIYLLQRGNP